MRSRTVLTVVCSVLAASLLRAADVRQYPIKVYSTAGGVVDAETGMAEDGRSVTFDWRDGNAQPVAVYDFGSASVGGYAVFRVTGFTPQATNAAGRAVGFPVLRLSYCTHPQGLRETGDFTRRKCIDYLGECFDNPVLPGNVNRFELYTIARNGTFIAPLVQGQERYLRVQLDTPGTAVSVDAFEIRNTGVYSREKPVGTFRCSDERVNRVWNMSAWTCQIASIPNNDAWRVVDGKLLPRKLERGSVAGFTKDRTWTDDGTLGVCFEMRTNPHYSGAIGLMLRARDEDDGVVVVAEQPAAVRIIRRKGGVNTVLARKVIDEPIVDGVPHRLEAQVEGGRVKAVFDGVSIVGAEVADTALSGRFGLYVEKEWWPVVSEVSLADRNGKVIFRDNFSAADDEGRLPGWDYTRSFRFMADGAKRDRLVWIGDLWWAERTCFYAFGHDWPYLRESLRLLAFNQNPEGYVWAAPFAENGVKPKSGEFGHFPSDEFSAWLVPVLWDYYLYQGDEALVRELFPAVKQDLAYLRSRCDDEGLFIQRIETSSNMTSMQPKDIRQRLFTQIVIWKAFDDGAKLARSLGRTAELAEWEAFAAKMAAVTRRRFYLPAERDFAQDLKSMTSARWSRTILMPTRFLTSDEAKALAGKIPLSGNANKTHLCALRGMFEYGYDESAFAMLEGGTWFGLSDPAWEGAHCCTECGMYTCDGFFDESHPDTAVAGPISTYLLGVEPVEPGYRRFRFAPHIVSRLTFAEGRVPTPHGFVEARWDRQGGVVTARLVVTAGTQAEVAFPKAKEVTVDGVAYSGAALGPGEHVIRATGLDDAAISDRDIVVSEQAGDGERWVTAPECTYQRDANPAATFEQTIDLGTICDIRAIELTYEKQNHAPAAVGVFVSSDGVEWAKVKEETGIAYPGDGRTVEVDLRTAGAAQLGRFVRLVYADLPGWLLNRDGLTYRQAQFRKVRVRSAAQ